MYSKTKVSLVSLCILALSPTQAQPPCDQSKYALRPFQPVDVVLPISAKTLTSAEIIANVSTDFKCCFNSFFFLNIFFEFY